MKKKPDPVVDLGAAQIKPAAADGALVPIAPPEPATVAALPPALTGPVSTRALWQSFRRHWVLAVTAGAAFGGLVAAAMWFLLPLPKLTAAAVLYVAANQPSIIGPTLESRTDFGTYRQSQATLIKSRLVLNAVVARPEVARLGIVRDQPDPVEWLDRQLVVDGRLGPEFLRVSMVGDHADDMKAIVQAITGTYLKEIVNKERDRRRARLEQLRDIHTRYEENLRQKRKVVRELAEAVGSGDAQVIAIKQRFAQEQLAMAQRELLQVKSELRHLDLEAKAGQTGRGPEPRLTSDELEDRFRLDPTVQQLRDRRDRLEEYIKQFERTAVNAAKHPYLATARKDLDGVRRSLDEATDKVRREALDRARERLAQVTTRTLEQITHRRELLRELEKVLTTEIADLTEKNRSLNVGQLDIESFRQDIGQVERIAERISGEMEALRVEMDAPPRVSLIEDAYVTQGDEGRRRLKYSGAAGAVAVLVALGLVVGRDYRQRRVAGPEDVAQGLGLAVVGTTPPPAGRARMAEDDWRFVMTESVDVIRTLLLHDCHVGRARAVMVTSALGGEGKTSLTGHLAASLTRAGYGTLVIDGDLRRPAIHTLLGLASTPGLCEVLRGEAAVAAAFQPSGIDRLTVLPAGRWSPAVAELLARHAWPALLAQLRLEFDFILIDTAPILPVVDTLLLGRATDGVILSVLRGQSQLRAVHAAQQRLARVGIRTFGAVINGVPDHTYKGRYSYAAAPASEDEA